jgi:hypothetical protein
VWCGGDKQRQAYPLSHALSRSSGGLERSLPQDDASLGTPGGDLGRYGMQFQEAGWLSDAKC